MNYDNPLPMGWTNAKVGEYCQNPEYGFTESAVTEKVGPKFLRITDITEQGVNWDDVPYCRCPRELFPKYELKENDILFARIGATTGKSYIVKNPPPAVFASYLIRLRPLSKVIPDYLYYFFNSDGYWNQVNANKSNNLKGGVNSSTLSDIRFPLPSNKEEQQKIAAVLFKIQKAIEIQESIIEKTRELKKSTLKHVFTHGLRGEKFKETEIGQLPDSWDVLPIGKAYDFTKKPREIVYSNYDQLPFIAMDLIPIDTPHLGNFKLRKSSEISSGTYIEDGDILLAKITPCFENGKQCVVSGLPNGFGIATTEIIPIKEIPKKSDKYYLYYYLLKDDVRKLITGKMEGATGRQRVPIHLMHGLLIPFPSLPEQKEIAKLFLTVDEKIAFHTTQKAALQDLFKTMLNKLMTGEIRVKDLDIDVSEVST